MKGAAAAMPGTPPLSVQRRATKRLRAGRALAGRSTLYPAEGDARVGGDGAGRPTSLGIFGGAQQPDSGRMAIDARPVICAGPYDGRHPGFSIDYQTSSFRGPSGVNRQVAEARSLNASVPVIDEPDELFPSFRFLDGALDRDDQQGRIEGA